MNNDKIRHAIINKTVTVKLITVESYQKLLELGYKVIFINSNRKVA